MVRALAALFFLVLAGAWRSPLQRQDEGEARRAGARDRSA